MKTLFDENDVLQQVYTVKNLGDMVLNRGDTAHALVSGEPSKPAFNVINCEGKVIGAIQGESARVLALELGKNQLNTVRLTVTEILPITGDARVKINLECF